MLVVLLLKNENKHLVERLKSEIVNHLQNHLSLELPFEEKPLYGVLFVTKEMFCYERIETEQQKLHYVNIFDKVTTFAKHLLWNLLNEKQNETISSWAWSSVKAIFDCIVCFVSLEDIRNRSGDILKLFGDYFCYCFCHFGLLESLDRAFRCFSQKVGDLAIY